MISAVTLTKNEEENIKDCLKSLEFCDERIVIDDNSTDDTVKLAIAEGAKVYQKALNSDFAAQRNFGLEKAISDWVLFIDADELISNNLSVEIMNKVKRKDIDGCFFKRQDIFMGKELKHGEPGNIKLLRLAQKNKGKWKRKVHEYWQIKGNVSTFKSALIHNSHKDLSEFIGTINYYSEIHARENVKENKRSSLVKILFFPILHFCNNFILKRGFMDGSGGFVFAFLMSFHSYLSWSKQWLIQK